MSHIWVLQDKYSDFIRQVSVSGDCKIIFVDLWLQVTLHKGLLRADLKLEAMN